jgi:hypothetical protein
MMLSTGQHTLTTRQSELDDEDSSGGGRNNNNYNDDDGHGNNGSPPHYYNKHCILVKLTDSSAKAIEEYLRSNKDSILAGKKPSIAFQRDRGVSIKQLLFICVFDLCFSNFIIIIMIKKKGNYHTG